jgi:hypothetical protein
MAKLTINDKDYYTDDFNEEQNDMHREIILAQSEIQRMDYLIKVLNARCNMLGGMIVEITEQEESDETETST